jgi:hypothetical protein
MATMTKRPRCKLSKTDDSVFYIIGDVLSALQEAGMYDRAMEFTKRAFMLDTNAEVLTICGEFVEVQ